MSPRGGAGAASRRRRGLSPTAISLLVLLVAGAISFYAFNEGLPFVHGFRLKALMSNSNALRRRSPVRIAGITVGKVVSVSPGPGLTTRVDMELDPSALPIHTDATIRVRPRLFVEGGYYVALSPGSPSAPQLHDGATIPLPQTRSAVQLYQLLSAFEEPTRTSGRRVLRTFAAALAHGGVKGLRAGFAPLGPALRDVAIASQASLGRRPHDLSTVVGASARVSTALSADESALGGLVTNFNITAAALASQDGALGDSISQLDGVLRVSPPALSALDRVLPRLSQFSANIDPGLVAAPRLLRALSATVTEFGAIVAPRERDRVVGALRATLISFPNLLSSLSALIAIGKPIADCVTSHVVPILNAQVPDGTLSTQSPVWKDIAHSLPGIASAAQNFDGNGYSLRYQAGASNQTVSTGALPGLGVLTGSQPGASPILGSRPLWSGRLGPQNFRPDQACTSQPLPKLDSSTGVSDLTPGGR